MPNNSITQNKRRQATQKHAPACERYIKERKVESIRIVLAVWLLAASFVNQAYGEDTQPKSELAWILVDIDFKESSENVYLAFEEIDTGEKFYSFPKKRGRKYRPATVQPGNYFLAEMGMPYRNFKPTKYRRPKSKQNTFKVKAGTTTFFGTWIIDIDHNHGRVEWDIERAFTTEFLKDQKTENPYLTEFPLIITNEDGKILPVQWNQI